MSALDVKWVFLRTGAVETIRLMLRLYLVDLEVKRGRNQSVGNATNSYPVFFPL